MSQKQDAVLQFASARAALVKERDTIQKRLRQIDAALGGVETLSGGTTTPNPPQKKRGRPPGPSQSSGDKMGIREAIAQVTAKQPLKIGEIVKAVQAIGYKFKSSNPMNSVGAFLYGPYGKKHFKRVDKKFQGK